MKNLGGWGKNLRPIVILTFLLNKTCLQITVLPAATKSKEVLNFDPAQPHGHAETSLKCEQPIDALTVQVYCVVASLLQL